MSVAIKYTSNVTAKKRKSINEEIISCCENLNVDRLYELFCDNGLFEEYDAFLGLANFRDKFNEIKGKGHSELSSRNSICMGCDHGHIVKAFYNVATPDEYQFAILFSEVDGVSDHVVFCAQYVQL